MEGQARRYRTPASPERSRAWVEPSPPRHKLQQERRIPVVYYLCRNRHLEHPHFIEVPISSPEGLYLRDVIHRLNVLRGKGMAGMYSWSCKRSYKNGFVWHDLSEDDLILPAHGNEYVLKGSELLDQSPSAGLERIHHVNGNSRLKNTKHSSQEASSSSPPTIVIKEAKPAPPPCSPPPPQLITQPAPDSQEEELSLVPSRLGSSSNASPEGSSESHLNWKVGSPLHVECRAQKPIAAMDAATQTEDRGRTKTNVPDTCVRGVSTDESSLDLEFDQTQSLNPKHRPKNNGTEFVRNEISPPPTSSSASSSGAKTETLESLIRAEASRIESFRIHEEEDLLVSTGTRLRATNMLMQLLTCGSISVKDHHSFGLVPTYRPRISHVKFPAGTMFSGSMMLAEADYLSENPSFMGLRMEDKEYFSGSLIETKKHKDEVVDMMPTLKRSSSYNADRTSKSPESKREKGRVVDSSRLKCLPRTKKIIFSKQSRNEMVRSPLSEGPRNSSALLDCSNSTSACSSRGASKRITDVSSVKGSSMRLESFKGDKEKVIKIEERLTSGARVIIQSTTLCDSNDSSGSG